MSILYKNARNVIFVLFRKNSSVELKHYLDLSQTTRIFWNRIDSQIKKFHTFYLVVFSKARQQVSKCTEAFKRKFVAQNNFCYRYLKHENLTRLNKEHSWFRITCYLRRVYLTNKKVLLRERKNHTARRVASTRCAALSNPDLVSGGLPSPRSGGVPSPRSGGGVPSPRSRGVPGPRSGGYPMPGPGVPHLGTPLPRPRMGYLLPGPGMGYPLPRPGMGYPLYLDLGWGTPYLDLR